MPAGRTCLVLATPIETEWSYAIRLMQQDSRKWQPRSKQRTAQPGCTSAGNAGLRLSMATAATICVCDMPTHPTMLFVSLGCVMTSYALVRL